MPDEWIVILVDRRKLGLPQRALGEKFRKGMPITPPLVFSGSDEARSTAQGLVDVRTRSRWSRARPLLIALAEIHGPGFEVVACCPTLRPETASIDLLGA